MLHLSSVANRLFESIDKTMDTLNEEWQNTQIDTYNAEIPIWSVESQIIESYQNFNH